MSWFGKKKEKAKEFTGFPGDLSPEQQQALDKFRIYVIQKKKTNTDNFDDVYLLRFLRARKFDIPKTTKMWDEFIDWRVKKDIDNYIHFRFPQLPELRKMYPHGYHKVDKQFRPIYIERVGFMDVDKIFKVMSTDNMLQYYAVLYETLLTTIFDGCTKAKQIATGEKDRVTQTVTILDLKHVKLGNAGKAYDFVKPVSAMAQNNYPQILGNMFIVNAPMLFTGIWAIVKMWIDDKTKQKIKILGSSYKKQLLEFVDAENLPAFFDGGKCKCNGQQCKLECNVGPWNLKGEQLFAENIYGQSKNPKVNQIAEKSEKLSLSSQQKPNLQSSEGTTLVEQKSEEKSEEKPEKITSIEQKPEQISSEEKPSLEQKPEEATVVEQKPAGIISDEKKAQQINQQDNESDNKEQKKEINQQ